MTKIERLMALCDEATPGRWFVDSLINGQPCVRATLDGVSSTCVVAIPSDHPNEAGNHQYIADANPETLRAMLTLMQEMRNNLIASAGQYEVMKKFDRWNELGDGE